MAYTTNQSLLAAIRNGDEVSWREFYRTYLPLIVHCGQGVLRSSEIDDLVQNVMLKIFHAGPTFRYDPARGRFRSYLSAVIRNAITDILRRRAPEAAPDAAAMPDGEAFDSFEQKWEKEWHKHLLTQAAEILKTRVSAVTFQAFDLHVMQEMPVKETAAFLEISSMRVYKAKLRCLALLKTIVAELREAEES